MTKKNNIIALLFITGFWLALIILSVILTYYIRNVNVNVEIHEDDFSILSVIWESVVSLFSFIMVSYINFFWLAPRYLFRKKYGKLFLFNILIILLCNVRFFYAYFTNQIPENYLLGYIIGVIIFFLMNFGVAATAVGIRSIIHSNEMKSKLKEEQQKNAEAELAWLKNQLNPHFLFNTLNNISSLTQIDTDAAQDSIAKLSDLLRYALYETNKKTVPISNEVEFLHNYIDLMALRCGSNTQVETDFNIQNESMEIVPLLFISLIENAFKHGVSSNKPTFIHIGMTNNLNSLSFICENGNFPKDDKNRSGSGIGLENMKRRLELLYPGHYSFTQWIEDDTYKVFIQINTLS